GDSGRPLMATLAELTISSPAVSGSSNLPAATTAQKPPAATRDFACPEKPSSWFGTRPCNLVLFRNDDVERESFEKLAGFVGEFDPTIHTVIVKDQPGCTAPLPGLPTFFFSP